MCSWICVGCPPGMAGRRRPAGGTFLQRVVVALGLGPLVLGAGLAAQAVQYCLDAAAAAVA